MLKIRDDIDLKELEKYGFKKVINCFDEIYWFKKVYCNDEEDSRLFYEIYEKTDRYFTGRAVYIDTTGGSRADDTLYDLIKDDLVEKVEQC